VQAKVETRVVIADGKSVATDRNGGLVGRYTFRIVDATSTPRKLDLIDVNGQAFQAVYAFDGDTFVYCGSYARRPAELTTKAGDGRYKATLKRVNVKKK
jgi:uncharacterized protein (TIGR03067 family)